MHPQSARWLQSKSRNSAVGVGREAGVVRFFVAPVAGHVSDWALEREQVFAHREISDFDDSTDAASPT